MNKKGLGPFVLFFLIALGIILFSGVFSGFGISNGLKSIPMGIWIILALFILIIFMSRGKKR